MLCRRTQAVAKCVNTRGWVGTYPSVNEQTKIGSGPGKGCKVYCQRSASRDCEPLASLWRGIARPLVGA